MNRPNIVSIVRSGYGDLNVNLEKAISTAGGMDVSDRDSIAIKINLCAARGPETGAITHPLFLDGLLQFLREECDDTPIYVVESDATTAQPDLFIRWYGFIPVLEKWKAQYVNLSKAPFTLKGINGLFFEKIPVPKIFEDAFIITVPKLKTLFFLTDITCCLKNQFGCLPILRKAKYHPWIDDVIADVNTAYRPDLCLVDAIIAMGGELGPAYGTPIPLNTIVYGKDPVAVDSFCARLMGLNPSRIGHIRKAAQVGIGSTKYELVGDELPLAGFEIRKFKALLFKWGSRLQARFQLS